jgi:hypothetical protein
VIVAAHSPGLIRSGTFSIAFSASARPANPPTCGLVDPRLRADTGRPTGLAIRRLRLQLEHLTLLDQLGNSSIDTRTEESDRDGALTT